jgi:ribosome-interacting GTPase 1
LVTNLPPQAKQKWIEVTQTKNPENKLVLMQEFLRMIPKHKGTDNMCKQVKRQISQLKEDIDKTKKQAKKTSSGPSYYVQKAGAAQVAVIGPTNAGRSSLLRAVTNSQVLVTAYPFGTMMPIPGMLPYEDIQFQLVEIPPIVEGSSEGKVEGSMNLSSARNADAIIIMVDLNDDPVGNFEMVKRELEASRLLIVEPLGSVEIIKRGTGRDLQFVWEGELVDCSEEDIIQLLASYRIKSALVKIKGKVSLDVVEDSMFGNAVYRPTFVVANKMDLNNDPRNIEQLLQVTYPLQLHVVSVEKMKDLTKLIGQTIFDMLGIVRVYTKERGKGVATIPIVVREGTTVGELAKIVHNDFFDRFKYARVWGAAAKFDNEKVGLDRLLKDGTTIQIYT